MARSRHSYAGDIVIQLGAVRLNAIGFSGTKKGMTPDQKCCLARELQRLAKAGATEFHHGDCVGADDEAHDLAVAAGMEVITPPPINTSGRAWRQADRTHKPMKYLARNHVIAETTDRLIACPFQYQEILRSGTWATVRYARKAGRSVLIIWPDGQTETESGRWLF